MRTFSTWTLTLSIYGGYILVAMIATYPAVTGLIYPYTLPSTGLDSLYFLWHLWWIKHALLELGVTPTFTTSIFYPLGGVLLLASPFNELAAVTLQPLMGLTQTFTFLWLFSFPTAALTAYLLCYYLSRNRWAALMGGLIFSFSAYHYDRADRAHLGLWTIQWLPLYTLALFLLLRKPSFKTATLTTITFVLAVMSEHVYYFFYFIAPVTGLIIVYYWFNRQLVWSQARFWGILTGAFLAGLVLVLPVYLHLLPNQADGFIKAGGVTRYSADVLAYLTPLKKYKDTGHDLFIGYVAIFLSLVAVRVTHPSITRLWLLLAGLAFIFSLGPILHINGPVVLEIETLKTYIPLPYALLLNLPLIGVLRAPARLAVIVQLAVAVLATFGVAALSQRWRGVGRVGGYLIFGGLILFESRLQLSPRLNPESLIPAAIYEQIAQEQNSLAVLEIPSRMVGPGPIPTAIGEQKMYSYMYNATIHRHPLVGGQSSRTPPTVEAFLDTTLLIRELTHPEVWVGDNDILPINQNTFLGHGADFLAKHNIGYVIIHRDLLAKFVAEPSRSIPEVILRRIIGAPFYDDGNIIGFRVPPIVKPGAWHEEAIVLADGWYPPTLQDTQPLRWASRTSQILVSTVNPELRRLSLTAFSASKNPVELALLVNDIPIETFQLNPMRNDMPTPIVTKPFALKAGLNQLSFEVNVADSFAPLIASQVYWGAYQLKQLPILNLKTITPMYPQRVSLANRIELIGYDQNQEHLQGGDTLRLILYWRALTPIMQSYKVFIHILDSQGQIRAQQDKIPHDWLLPTTSWGEAEAIADSYEFAVPPDVPPGHYQIQIGMYLPETLERLKVSNGPETGDETILLAGFEIE